MQKPKKVPKKSKGSKVPADPPLDIGTTDEPILLDDDCNVQNGAQETTGPDEIRLYTFFIEGQGNLPIFSV